MGFKPSLRTIQEFGLPAEINLPKRIAILPDQIEEYKFPLLNIEQDPKKKKPNPNLREYKRRFGDKATHLNAFFTKKHFESFKEILLAAVDEHWYEEIYNTMIEVYEVEPDEPESLPEEELKEKRQEMYRKITAAFAPGWFKDMKDAPYYW